MAQALPPQAISMIYFFDTLRIVICCLSVLLALLAVLMAICATSSKAGRDYRPYLMTVLVIGICSDIYMAGCFAPIPLLPYPCLYANGLFSKSFGIPAHPQMAVLIFLFAWNTSSIIACFIFRHQVIMLPGSRFLLPPWLKFFLILIFFAILNAAAAMILVLYDNDTEDQDILNSMVDGWPERFQTRAVCYSNTAKYFVVALLIALALGTLFMVTLSAHIFFTLASHSNLSAKTRIYHKRMTRILILQATLPTATLFLPLVGLGIQNELNYIDYVLSFCLVQIAGMHTTTHSVALIITTRAYRADCRTLIKNIFSKLSTSRCKGLFKRDGRRTFSNSSSATGPWTTRS